ncbi:MAG: tetratricopeptide repeat protein [Balneolaceae bacterium]
MSFELKDFQKDVIEACRIKPVVIDFWAPWCGPCKQLGPVIEKLAGEAKGRWKLVKINTDQHPELATQFNVRGIPSVKMVYENAIIAEFTGAQPEPMIRKWLEENLPDHIDDEPGWEESVNEKLAAGDRKAALKAAEKHAKDADDILSAKLAMLYLPGNTEQAKKWIGNISEKINFEIEIEAFETVLHLKKIKDGTITLNGSESVSAYLKAIEELFSENFNEALDGFIQCLQTDRQLDDDGARKACIAIFQMLGEVHPLTQRYRRIFSMSLY